MRGLSEVPPEPKQRRPDRVCDTQIQAAVETAESNNGKRTIRRGPVGVHNPLARNIDRNSAPDVRIGSEAATSPIVYLYRSTLLP
jgi:hypothetical protein